MNRVTEGASKVRVILAGLNGVGKNGMSLEDLDKQQDLTFEEHFQYQEIQSHAFASGKISFAEAQTIYVALGEGYPDGGWMPGTDLATKITITKIIAELLDLSPAPM